MYLNYNTDNRSLKPIVMETSKPVSYFLIDNLHL